MITVFSLVARTCEARPRCSRPICSNANDDALRVHLAAAQRGHVLQQVHALLAEPGRLDRGDLEVPVDVVVHQHLQRGALDLLGHDHQRPRSPHDAFEHRHQRADVGDLLGREQQVRVVEDREHAAGVGDEVRRDVAVVELEVLDEVDLDRPSTGPSSTEMTPSSPTVCRVCATICPIVLVVVGRDRGDAREVLQRVHRVRDGRQVLDDRAHGEVDAPLDQHRVAAGRDRLHALADDGLRDDRGGRGAVADGVVRLDRGFLEDLRAHVLERVAQVDLPRDRHAVVGDLRGSR